MLNPKILNLSGKIFHDAFSNGFLWELIEVLAGGPPNVTFKWRHWGTFSGSYKGHEPTGEVVEVVGISVARVTAELNVKRGSPQFQLRELGKDSGQSMGFNAPLIDNLRIKLRITSD